MVTKADERDSQHIRRGRRPDFIEFTASLCTRSYGWRSLVSRSRSALRNDARSTAEKSRLANDSRNVWLNSSDPYPLSLSGCESPKILLGQLINAPYLGVFQRAPNELAMPRRVGPGIVVCLVC